MNIDLRTLTPDQIQQLILIGEGLKRSDRNVEKIEVGKNSIKYTVVWTSSERQLFIGTYCFLMEYSGYKHDQPPKHEIPIKYDVPVFAIYEYLQNLSKKENDD